MLFSKFIFINVWQVSLIGPYIFLIGKKKVKWLKITSQKILVSFHLCALLNLMVKMKYLKTVFLAFLNLLCLLLFLSIYIQLCLQSAVSKSSCCSIQVFDRIYLQSTHFFKESDFLDFSGFAKKHFSGRTHFCKLTPYFMKLSLYCFPSFFSPPRSFFTLFLIFSWFLFLLSVWSLNLMCYFT